MAYLFLSLLSLFFSAIPLSFPPPSNMAWAVAASIMLPSALLAVLIAVPPLFVHTRARNFACSVVIGGTIILNLQSVINAAIWHSPYMFDAWNGKILCDIEVKLSFGVCQAIGGAIVCIFRQLAIILRTEKVVVMPTLAKRKRPSALELVLCVLLPVYVMIGHYFTQRPRYWVRSTAGCILTIDQNYAAPFLTYLWPSAVSLVGTVYCLISTIRLCHHRRQMSSVFSTTPPANKSRFLRIFALATALLAIFLPLTIFSFAQNVRTPKHVYSWSHVHPADWADQIYFDVDGRAGGSLSQIALDRWAFVVAAYISFALFGLGHEAMEMYKRWITWVKKLAGKGNKTLGLPDHALPVSVRTLQHCEYGTSSVGYDAVFSQNTGIHSLQISELSA
jgi:pheromone a factor receptor